MAEPATRRGRPRKPQFRQWKGIPKDAIRIAYDRTEYLMERHPLSVQTYKMALANAYLQGIADAGEAQEGREDG